MRFGPRIAVQEICDRRIVELEAKKFEIVFGQQGPQFRTVAPVLHDVEKQIATAAGAVEVFGKGRARNLAKRVFVAVADDGLAQRPNASTVAAHMAAAIAWRAATIDRRMPVSLAA